LGNDRIALVSSASIKYPHENVLIIDVGTCITYDFINNENQYTGGAISPGLNMRLRSLNKFTGKLPLIKLKEIDNFNGLNTKDSINIGVLKGVIFEIQGFINKYSSDNQNLTVILTGGNSKFLSKQLKISIFANQNFLVEGLNELIKLNIKN
jgi:type III pantothenate kinase